MYKIKNELCIFDYRYDKPISNKISHLLTNCNIIIFSDYGTYEATLKKYNNLYNGSNFKGSIFNEPLDNLPITIKKIFLGYSFNHPINNLPFSLKILVVDNIGRYFCDEIIYPNELNKLNKNLMILYSADFINRELEYIRCISN